VTYKLFAALIGSVKAGNQKYSRHKLGFEKSAEARGAVDAGQ